MDGMYRVEKCLNYQIVYSNLLSSRIKNGFQQVNLIGNGEDNSPSKDVDCCYRIRKIILHLIRESTSIEDLKNKMDGTCHANNDIIRNYFEKKKKIILEKR